MPTPTRSQVHIDGPLTNISIAYRNGNYIAEQIFPAVKVQKNSDKYFIYTKSDWFRDEAAVRAPGTRAQLVDYTISNSTYSCFEYADAKVVPDEVVDNADTPLRPLQEATEFVTDKLLLRQEIDVAAKAFGTSWSSSATPGTLWSNDTSDPVGDVNLAVDTIAKAIGRVPSVGVIGRGLWRHVTKHPDLMDRIKGAATPGSPAILTYSAIAAILELEKIVVGNAIKDTGAEGGTSSLGYVWGNHMLVAFVTSTPSLLTPSAGYIFNWKSRMANRYRLEPEHSDLVECLQSWATVLTAVDAGYKIVSAA